VLPVQESLDWIQQPGLQGVIAGTTAAMRVVPSDVHHARHLFLEEPPIPIVDGREEQGVLRGLGGPQGDGDAVYEAPGPWQGLVGIAIVSAHRRGSA